VRVVLLVTDLERGGTPLRLARLARGLLGAGVEVHVGCLAPSGPVSEQLTAAGVPTFACDARSARDLSALRRLDEHIRRIHPDLIHATLTHANVAARLIGLLRRIPVIGSTATIEVERRWHRWAELLTARVDRRHIVTSVALADHVARAFLLPRRRIRIVPPALDPPAQRVDRAAARAALGVLPQEFVVLWAGRFDPVKRVDLVIRCAEIMSVVPSRFLIAGDGPDRLRVEQAVRLGSAAGRVHLLGWRDDLDPLFAAADCLLFPSRTEGMPNVVLQAMAAGLPVVASDIPALRDLSAGGRRLVLVAGDEPQPFARALLDLREHPAERTALARAAANWAAANLDPQRTLTALTRVYRQTLRTRRHC
jgi:glycosyltransferase involved in cell wall biosynthesis